jgi:hypothetical protein
MAPHKSQSKSKWILLGPIYDLALYAAGVRDNAVEFAKNVGFDQAWEDRCGRNRQNKHVGIAEVIQRHVGLIYGATRQRFSKRSLVLVETQNRLRDTHLAKALPDRAADLAEADDPDGSEIEASHVKR